MRKLLLLRILAFLLPCTSWTLRRQKTPLQELSIEPLETKAYALQTPHSGRHFLPSHSAYRQSYWRKLLFSKNRGNSRFTEGWYYRLTLKDVSFAIIISMEDPGHRPPSDLRLACIQVIGPRDGYIVQADRDDSLFWAWDKQQGLGCNFEYKAGYDKRVMNTRAKLSPEVWRKTVQSGFQILPTHLLGRVRGRNGTFGGLFDDTDEVCTCDFDFHVVPLCGWGDVDGTQKSTAGWLASFEVFEPHWQVTMADARASGQITWNNQTYEFVDAPFYAEKNWGAALPTKWYWTQCNSFDGYEQLSVTAGGGIRLIPFGRKESLGMVSVHYNGKLFEAVPWTGSMRWKVSTWGYWELEGKCTVGERPFEVQVIYECNPDEIKGLVFRAPTPEEGMVRFCKDTFEAKTTLSLWELEWDSSNKSFVRKDGPPLIDRAQSNQGGAEIGGGPWWDKWERVSELKQPIRSLLRLPIRLKTLGKKLKQRVWDRQ